MKFAIVGENKRCVAKKGEQGICPECGCDVIAKCGKLKAAHWAHKILNPDCKIDKNKGPWHDAWQNEFDENWQEYRLVNQETGEVNIADIRLPNGFVIEFQHSSISQEEIEAREDFYTNKEFNNSGMIWVVDGNRYRGLKKRIEEDFSTYNIPEQWLNNKVPILFDFDNDENNETNSNLYCLFPQDFKYKTKIINKEDFISFVKKQSIKDYFHNEMVLIKKEKKEEDLICAFKTKIQEKFLELEDDIYKNIQGLKTKPLIEINRYESFLNYLKNGQRVLPVNSKLMRKVNNKWFIFMGKSVLSVNLKEGIEYPIKYNCCLDNKIITLEDYYNNVNENKVVYEGNAYNGEECKGVIVAKVLNKVEKCLYLVCKELNGAFYCVGYNRNKDNKWLKSNNITNSYNFIKITLDNNNFIHEHYMNFSRYNSIKIEEIFQFGYINAFMNGKILRKFY